MGVSETQGPQYKLQNSRAFIVRTPENWTPNLQKQPYGPKEGYRDFGPFLGEALLSNGAPDVDPKK